MREDRVHEFREVDDDVFFFCVEVLLELSFFNVLCQKGKTGKDPLGVGVTKVVVLDSIQSGLEFFLAQLRTQG